MIEIAPIENSPIVEIRVDGTITKDDIDKINTFFESEVNESNPVNILLQMDHWEGLTLKGLIEDFKLIKQLKKMNKAAVVADSAFLRADAKVENVFPGIKVEHFEPNELTSAKRWLKDTTLDNEGINEHLYE